MISQSVSAEHQTRRLKRPDIPGHQITILIDSRVYVRPAASVSSIKQLVEELNNPSFYPTMKCIDLSNSINANCYICDTEFFYCYGRLYKIVVPFVITDLLNSQLSTLDDIRCLIDFGVVDKRVDYTNQPFSSVEYAIQEFENGKFVLVLDDEGRENEGDLIIAAQDVSPSQLAFMVNNTTGIICAPMLAEDLERLKIGMMISEEECTDKLQTAFTISVDACRSKHGTTTGVSANDRATTLRVLANASSTPEDFTRPGHVFPLRCCPGGLKQRRGHTEAAIELCKLSGKRPVAVIGEVVNLHDGSMARRDDLIVFAHKYNIPLISINQLEQFSS